MNLKVVCWNVKRAKKEKDILWNKILSFDADILLLQEVISFPQQILDLYKIQERKATKKNGSDQLFSTALLVKAEICYEIKLFSKHDWVNKELDFFKGNLIAFKIRFKDIYLNVVSIYSPAWEINRDRLRGVDISMVKLEKNPDLWCATIFRDALKNNMLLDDHPWIIGGDFNSSPTFDKTFSSGCQESIDRYYALGLKECLKEYNGKLIPTFKNTNGGRVVHQIDHLYVTNQFYENLNNCYVTEQNEIFDNNLSDHLPIIANFKILKNI
jgi:exonuclease III